MENLKNNVEELIQESFDDFICEANISEIGENAITERIKLLIDDVFDLLDEAKRDIDDVVYQHSQQYINDIKDDMKTQEYLERDLF